MFKWPVNDQILQRQTDKSQFCLLETGKHFLLFCFQFCFGLGGRHPTVREHDVPLTNGRLVTMEATL